MSYLVGIWNSIKNNTPVLITLIVCILLAFIAGAYFAAHYGILGWVPQLLGVN